jgi:cysteine desulfurase
MRKVYLDHVASTPLHPRVREAMLPYLDDLFGNPQSLHEHGDQARQGVDEARAQVARLLNAQPAEIIFTSCGTEANNMAIKGIAMAQQKKGKHVVTSQIEHFSILHAVKTLEKWGFRSTQVQVDKHGTVDPDDIAKAITSETVLVSVMHANTEVGTIEPIADIARVCKDRGVFFHTDAVGTAGSLPVDVTALGVDALSLSGYQFYGPKGSGALYLRKGVRLIPLMEGGIQEDGRRPGIENVPGIAGLGAACEIAGEELPQRIPLFQGFRDTLIKRLTGEIDHVYLTGHPTQRLPGHVSVCVEYIEGEAMLMFLSMEGVAASSGSACTSRALKASHVLTSMGIDHALAQGSLMFTFGKDNTAADVDRVLEVLPPIVQRLRAMSPLYRGPQ